MPKDYIPRCWKCWEKLKIEDNGFMCEKCQTKEKISPYWLEYVEKKMKAA